MYYQKREDIYFWVGWFLFASTGVYFSKCLKQTLVLKFYTLNLTDLQIFQKNKEFVYYVDF